MSDVAIPVALRQRLGRHRHWLMGLGALLCAAIAVHAGQRYLDERLEAERARLAPEPVAMDSVVVARRDLAKGEPVSVETMAIRAIPKAYMLSAAIRPAQFEQYQGARLAIGLKAGEPLLDSAVVGVDQAVFSQRLRQGIRALTIAVDEVNAISGLLQPGDRVDLFFSARSPKGGQARGETTVPLLQNVLVLATGRQVRPLTDQQGAGRGYSTITVELAPRQAQQIVVAQRAGRITAVLRHPDDRRLEASAGMDLGQLFGVGDSAPAARRGPQMIIGGIGRVAIGGSAGTAGAATGPAAAARPGGNAPAVMPGRPGERRPGEDPVAVPAEAPGAAGQPLPPGSGLPASAPAPALAPASRSTVPAVPGMTPTSSGGGR